MLIHRMVQKISRRGGKSAFLSAIGFSTKDSKMKDSKTKDGYELATKYKGWEIYTFPTSLTFPFVAYDKDKNVIKGFNLIEIKGEIDKRESASTTDDLMTPSQKRKIEELEAAIKSNQMAGHTNRVEELKKELKEEKSKTSVQIDSKSTDAPNYYQAIVEVARRQNNTKATREAIRSQLEPIVAAYNIPFNEEQFNQAFSEFRKAGNPRSAFFKGRDGVNWNGERSFQSYEAWKRAVKQIDPNVKIEGDRDIAQAGKIGEWDGAKGIIYNTTDTKTKDRKMTEQEIREEAQRLAEKPLDNGSEKTPGQIAIAYNLWMKILTDRNAKSTTDRIAIDGRDHLMERYKGVDIFYDKTEGTYWAAPRGGIGVTGNSVGQIRSKIDTFRSQQNTHDDAPVYTQGKYSVYFDENEKKYLVFLSGEPRAIAAAESLSGAKDRIKEDKDRYANNKYNPYNTHDAKNLADLPDVKYKGYLISLNAYGEYFVSRNNHGNWQPIPNAKFGNENNAKSYIDTLPKVTTDRKSNLHPRWRKSGDKAAIRKIKDCLMGIKKTRDASTSQLKSQLAATERQLAQSRKLGESADVREAEAEIAQLKKQIASLEQAGQTKDSKDIYTKDPLTEKGEKILAAMKKAYGEEKGEQIFYASKNKGTISGVDVSKDANSFSAAVEMSKEYGKGTTVVDLTKATDSKTKDGSLDEIIRNMAREKADVPHNDDGTIRTPQQAQLAYERWYKIIKSRYKNDSRYSAEYGDSKTKDKVMDCPNCKNPLTYAGEENGKTKYKCGLCGKKFVSKDYKAKDERIDRKFIASCPACQEMKKYGLSYEETHSSHTPGKLLVEVDGREKEISNPHIIKDSSDFYTKDPLTDKGRKIL